MNILRQFFLSVLDSLGLYRTVLDIGNGEIRLLSAIRFFGHVKMTDLKTQKITNRNVSGAIKTTLKDLHAPSLTLSFSGANIIPVFFTLPKMSADRLRSVLPAEIGKRLPLDISEIKYQYRVLSVSRTDGMEKMNILAVCVRREEYEKIMSAIKEAGFKPGSAVYLPMQVLYSVREKMNAGNTGAAIISPNSIYLTVLDNGAPRSFAVFNGSFQKINAVTVKNIIRYFQDQAGASGIKPERIGLFAKSGALLPSSLPDTLSETLGCRIVIMDRKKYSFRTGNARTPEDHADLFGYLKNETSPFAVDFLENIFSRISRTAFRAAIWAILLLDIAALIAIPLGIGTVLEYGRIQQLRKTGPAPDADTGTKELYSRILQARTLDDIRNEITGLQVKITDMKRSGATSSRTTAVISEISRLIPPDAKLKSVSVNLSAGEMNGVAGNSDSLDKFIRALTGSKIFKAVSLKKAELSNEYPSGAVEFSLSFEAGL